MIWGEFYHLGTSLQYLPPDGALPPMSTRWRSQAQRMLYVLANATPYVYIIDHTWNKISSTFGKCTHCGHQSGQLGCIVDHKVFLFHTKNTVQELCGLPWRNMGFQSGSAGYPNNIIIIIIINTVSVMFDNYDWRMMLKLLGVSSYRRRIKADRRLKGGAKTMYVLVG